MTQERSVTAVSGRAPVAWRPLQHSTRLAILGALVATVLYQLFLLTPEHRGNPWLWGATVVAEGLAALQALGMWWTILAHDDQPESGEVVNARALLAGGSVRMPTVDIFVTACGEPTALVMVTARAARDMHLPHATYVLDDGSDEALVDACLWEGIGYLRRPDRRHAKAGNVNAALARTQGEYVVILDADHVPEPDLLIELLPHFVDPDVAFVQSPQNYINPVNLVAKGAAEAQRIFYELICPGKNHFNAAFCVGTNVMFRRSALDEIGGIYTGSNSEDIWTSLELHRRGWRSVYVPQVLARGLAPDDVPTYLKQQLRWCCGGFEVLLRGKLWSSRGLTLDQRLQYVFTGTHYLTSLSMLIFLLMPASYLMLGLSPIAASGVEWAVRFVPFIGLTLLVTLLQAGGLKPAAIVTSIGAAPIHLRGLITTVLRRKARWNVTHGSKRGAATLWPVMPHIALLLLNVTAIAIGLYVMADPGPTLLAAAFAAGHVLVLATIIAQSLRAPARHELDDVRPPIVAAPSRSGRGGRIPVQSAR